MLLENDGAGVFARAASLSCRATVPVGAIAAGDLDGDGDADLVLLRTTASEVRWNDGSGTFAAATPLPGLHASSVTIADLDEDGDADILTAHPVGVHVLVGDGSGGFLDTGSRWGGPPALVVDVVVQDFDGDLDCGALDTSGFVPVSQVLHNHTRQLASKRELRIGGQFELARYSGPGYSAVGLSVLIAGLVQPPAPLLIPGIDGGLELDPGFAAVAAVVPTNPVGVSTFFGSVPNAAALVGLDVFFQLGVLTPNAGAGWSNAIVETVRS